MSNAEVLFVFLLLVAASIVAPEAAYIVHTLHAAGAALQAPTVAP